MRSMISSLRRMRGCRAIPVLLTIAFLPHIGVCRCIGGRSTHAGCDALAAAAHAHTGKDHGNHAAHGGPTAESQGHHQSHGDKQGRAHTCCGLMSKCNIKITSDTPSPPLPQLMATLSAGVHAVVPHPELLHRPPAAAVAHGPPTYLRNVTLRI